MSLCKESCIGIDFDNTIVDYDQLFYDVARECSLIPSDIDPHKTAVRNYLRSIGNEESWTTLQGRVYGAEMLRAPPFNYAIESLKDLKKCGFTLCIISHKTRFPFAGPKYDLHASASSWLLAQGLVSSNSHESICVPFFETTKAAKLERIKLCRCDTFIDDLPEILFDDAFPAEVRRLLFDPNSAYQDDPRVERRRTWTEVREALSI